MLLSKEEILSIARSIPIWSETEDAKVVYFLINENEIVYIGQSRNLPTRMSMHKNGKITFDSYSLIYVDDAEQRNFLESRYINEYKPINNIKNSYERSVLYKEHKELIKQLNEKFDSFILIAKDEKHNKIYFETKPYWMNTISLFENAFEKYPKIKRLLKASFFQETNTLIKLDDCLKGLETLKSSAKQLL